MELFGRPIYIPIIKNREFLLDRLPKGCVCAEIGVHKGDFAEKILEITAPRKLHLIDPWEYMSDNLYKDSLYGSRKGINQKNMDERYESVMRRFEQEIKSGVVEVHRSSSEDASKEFSNNYFDWVYIDGNHLYEFVKKDLNLYYSKVKEGGLLTGDDYHSFAIGTWWGDGVTKAVDEFLDSGICKKILIRNQQFILQK